MNKTRIGSRKQVGANISRKFDGKLESKDVVNAVDVID